MRRIVLFIVLWMALSARAEEETLPSAVALVQGVVLDEGGMPLAGASVWVKGTTVGAGTNARGEFVLALRKSGRQVLRFSFTGYQPQEVVWEGKEDAELTIRLEPSCNSLDEVVITGTRTPKPLKEVPVLTRVVSEREIRQINPPDFRSLLEFALPGLQFGTAHGSNLPTLKFQGAEGGYVLFLVDGERIGGEGSNGNIDFERIDVDNIARIEVVKGAMSALYGAQAMGGVVNIITKNADRPFTADVSARVGSKDEMKYSASVGTKLNRFSSYTTFSYRKSDPYEVKDKDGLVQEIHGRDSVWRDTSARGSSVVLGYDVWSLNERLGYSFTDNWKAELSAGYYRNNLQNPYEPDGVQDRFSTLTIHPKLHYMAGENHLLTLSYMMDDYVKREVYSDGFPDRKTMEDFTNTVRLNYSGKPAERHTVTAGVEVNTQRMHHYWFDKEALLDYAQRNYVLYVQEEWRATEAFSLVAGVRSDCHSDYGFHPSPNISLMYRWAGLSLRGGYGMGFRLPTLKELHAAYPMGGFGFMIYGNEDLKPEESHQGTFSVEYTKGVFNGSVAGYYTKYRNEIYLGTYEEEDGTLAQKYYNHESSHKTGVDVMGQVRLDCGFTFNGAYSYVNTHADVEGYNTSVFRPHSLTFTANYARQLGKVKASAALNGRWLSKVDVWNKDDDGNYVLTPYYAYTSVDLNLGARFPRGFRLALGLNNLMNFKAKNATADSSVIPQRGIEVVGTLGINLADLLKL